MGRVASTPNPRAPSRCTRARRASASSVPAVIRIGSACADHAMGITSATHNNPSRQLQIIIRLNGQLRRAARIGRLRLRNSRTKRGPSLCAGCCRRCGCRSPMRTLVAGLQPMIPATTANGWPASCGRVTAVVIGGGRNVDLHDVDNVYTWRQATGNSTGRRRSARRRCGGYAPRHADRAEPRR
jgi:hypothetical protein